MTTVSNTLEYLYHLILHGQIMLNTLVAKLIKGLVSLIVLSIYYLLEHAFFFIIVNSLVMLLFHYADLVCGDKHNVTLISSLQFLQNKAAKIILDRPHYSSATFKWVPLEKRAFSEKMYLCV